MAVPTLTINESSAFNMSTPVYLATGGSDSPENLLFAIPSQIRVQYENSTNSADGQANDVYDYFGNFGPAAQWPPVNGTITGLTISSSSGTALLTFTNLDLAGETYLTTYADFDNWIGFEEAALGPTGAVVGGSGNDTFVGFAGSHSFTGGSGTNTITYAGAPNPVTVNLATGTAQNGYGGTDTLQNIEDVITSGNGNTLTGGSVGGAFTINGNNNKATAGAGAWMITAAGMDNTLIGGSGTTDFVDTGSGDTITGGSGTNTLDDSASTRSISVNLVTGVSIDPSGGTDSVSNIQVIKGSKTGSDTIVGSTGSIDYVLGSSHGHDTLSGGSNNELDYSTSTTLVQLSVDLQTGIDSLGDSFSNVTTVKGGEYVTFVVGNAGGGTTFIPLDGGQTGFTGDPLSVFPSQVFPGEDNDFPGVPGIEQMVTDSHGTTWVSGSNEESFYIDQISPNGTVTQITDDVGGETSAITVGSDGNLWYLTNGTGTDGGVGTLGIGNVTPTGTITFDAFEPHTVPIDITTGPNGNLWLTFGNTEYPGLFLAQVTTSGVFTQYDPAGGGAPMLAGYPQPPLSSADFSGITGGPDGNMWVVDWHDDTDKYSIDQFSTNGTFLNSFTVTAALTVSNPGGQIISGPDGALWFTLNGVNAIDRITTSGVVSSFALPTGYTDPSGLTVGADGALWFQDDSLTNALSLGRVTTTGVFSEYSLYASNGSNGVPISSTPGAMAAQGNSLLIANGSQYFGNGSELLQFAIPTANTLNFSSAPMAQNINLATGSWSEEFAFGNFTNVSSVVGSSFNDTFTVGLGNETINGGGGTDTVIFPGPEAQYTISTAANGTTTVIDSNGSRGGTYTLTGISSLQFSDQTIAVPAPGMAITAPFALDDNTLSVVQGTSAMIGPTLLRYGDGDTTAAGITYTVTSGPSDGMLLLNGSPTTSFTGAEINNNELSYQETAGGTTSDSFSFTVSDPYGNTTGTQIFQIAITPTTAPFVLDDSKLSLSQGTSATIGASLLRYGDTDTSSAGITYTVTSGPSDGTLLLNGNAATTFTGAQVNAGDLSYEETAYGATADSFSFTVSDPYGNKTPTQTFQIGITSNTAPFKIAESPLSLTQGASATIGLSLLRFGDYASTAAQVVYTVTSGPADGTLLLNGNATTSFTGAQVNAGDLSYQETAYGATADSFSFTVSDPYGNTTAPQTFNMAVTSTAKPFAIADSSLTLTQGASATIGPSLLRFGDYASTAAQVVYTVTSGPADGMLLLNGNATTTFTGAQVNAGDLSYKETAPGVTADSFSFTVSDPYGNVTPAETFSFQITSPPFALDDSPLTLTQGSNTTIGPSLLRYGDIDTSAAGLTYTVTSGPSDGTLLLNGNATTSFTGAQVNAGDLSYEETAYGATSDAFSFKVSDPYGNTTPTQTFDFQIVSTVPPFELTNSPLSIALGATATIGPSLLRFGDVASSAAQVVYTVTSGPSDGTLLLNGNATTSFTGAEVNSNQLTYHETAGGVSSDSFAFTVSDPYGNVTATQHFVINI